MMFQKNKIKLALLVHAGGTQTNLKAIREAIDEGKINAEIVAVISDGEDAAPILNKMSPDYICLAGWKKIIPDEIVEKYADRILNIHPGLIPDISDENVVNPDGSHALWNKGMYGNGAIQNFLNHKATFAGSSIHFLTLNFDFGPVLGRTFEKIKASDNVESLYERLKKKENKLYVEVLEKLTSPQPSPVRRGRKGEVIKILIIGSGGREHAIGWKVAQSPRAGQIFFAPGNGGTAEIGINVDIKATDISGILKFAKKEKIDLTLALPDDPLALGIVDEFQKHGLRIWGPTKGAAKLESSKAFAKDFMRRHGLPTAKFETFDNFEKAKKYVLKQTFPLVVKASGLALGKGVIVAKTKKEAFEALENMIIKKVFGDSGNIVVIEEFLTGPEISVHAFTDGKTYKMFPLSQDHKKIGEGNTGLNTGGMGTIAPLPFLSKKMMNEIEKNIVAPTIKAMNKEGSPFLGVIYPGLILTKNGPKILEYNARFGDPETQTYMRLLDGDLLDIFDAYLNGNLDKIEIKWKDLFACTVVLASGGYPENYEKGKIISGLPTPSRKRTTPQEGNDVVIFHAGTKTARQGLAVNLVTNGGRVLGVSAVGKSLEEALKTAYEAVEKISFEGMQYRKDIGKSALGKT